MKTNITIAMIAVAFNCFAQEEYVLWSFETGDRILSHPTVDGNIIYVGSNDNKLYAIDANSGEELWSFSTAYDVMSSVLINENMLYFECGNNCYALDKITGAELWMFSNDDPEGAEKLDPWDYHHASPVLDDTTVYFGCGDGRLYGFDKLNGELNFLYETIDSSAIRSTPVIQNGILYFGDWNGIIYALDILTHDTLWTQRTYGTQPYATFGMVNTQMIIHDTLLIFGARNPEVQVLNIHTGEVVWDYTVAGGGWISDRCGRKSTLLILTAGLVLGYLIMAFVDSSWSLTAAVLTAMFCSFFVQAGEGAVFATVPLIKRRMTGQIAGMTGAYGNVGAVVYLTVLSFVSYQLFFLVIAATAFLGLLTLLLLTEPSGQMAEINKDGSVTLIDIAN